MFGRNSIAATMKYFDTQVEVDILDDFCVIWVKEIAINH